MTKARLLTKLRIMEVSSVDHAANNGAKIVLLKRHDDNNDPVVETPLHKALQRIFRDFKIAKSNLADTSDDTIVDDTATPGKVAPSLEAMAAALQASTPGVSREAALRHLMFDHGGRSLARHLNEITKRTTTMPNAQRAQAIALIVKQHGFATVCKHIVDQGKSALTEFELTRLATAEAMKSHKPGESEAQAFTRLYTAPESLELRKAIAIAKNVSAQQIDDDGDGDRDTLETVDDDGDDQERAYQEMEQLAEVRRRDNPSLSKAQAFAAAFTDPANHELAKRAHRRPTAISGHPFPR